MNELSSSLLFDTLMIGDIAMVKLVKQHSSLASEAG